ncbi:MAG: hypothetical protein LBB66_04435 [Desulfovibrio sp.]|nr:hypothetical protein [Desulfovibrio sp.]
MFNYKNAAFVLFSLLLFFVVMSAWFTVEQGERGVLLRFGKVVDVAEPGFHAKAPFIDAVVDISVRTSKLEHKTSVYSKDIQTAVVIVSMNYSLNPGKVADIYTRLGVNYKDRVIVPQIMAKSKDVFGQYNAVEIVQSRERVTEKIADELQAQFEDTGIQIESVQIENIDFSDEYERSVEERMKAEVEVAKVRQNLERERLNADMVRARAQGEADARVMAAKSEAEAIKLRGEAEATAIKARAEALAQNQNLVHLIQAERWDGRLPQTMLPVGTLPIIDVLKK